MVNPSSELTPLYLIRHGIAAERGLYRNDADRPLTAAGQEKTQQVAHRLRSLGLGFDLLQTSPLVRAVQTAEILKQVGLASQIQVSPELAPEGSLGTWLLTMADWQDHHPGQAIAIVGHQPNLGDWAESLIWGTPQGRVVLKKAGIIGLHLPATPRAIGQSLLFWLTPPRLLLGGDIL